MHAWFLVLIKLSLTSETNIAHIRCSYNTWPLLDMCNSFICRNWHLTIHATKAVSNHFQILIFIVSIYQTLIKKFTWKWFMLCQVFLNWYGYDMLYHEFHPNYGGKFVPANIRQIWVLCLLGFMDKQSLQSLWAMALACDILFNVFVIFKWFYFLFKKFLSLKI